LKIVVILLIGIFIGLYYGYTNKSEIDTFDFSRFLPFKEKMAVKLSKDLVKKIDIPDKILDSNVSPLYCINTKTNIIKYYPQGTIATLNYKLISDLHCIYSDTIETEFNKIYYKNLQIKPLVDKHIKGYTD